MKREKKKVVLDTNIIISAIISQSGAPAKIFELFLNENIINYTSEEIIKELKRVIHRKEFNRYIDDSGKQFILCNFQDISLVIRPNTGKKIISDDPDDDKFINCALAAKACIISGDGHLLKLGKYKDVKILGAKEFLKKYGQ